MTQAATQTPSAHLADAFARTRAEQRTALVAYLMAGDPDIETTVELACAAVAAGVDVLELGVPFSDPLADGPVIQQAATRSIAAGTDLAAVLVAVRAIRARVDVPIILMGYVNPFVQYGLREICEDLAAAGGCGLLIPDMPPQENGMLREVAAAAGITVPLMVTPITPPARRAEIAAAATGFLYCMSITGTTGAREGVSADLPALLGEIRAECDLPVVVGFGISSPQHVTQLAPHADGVVVGSALVNLAHETVQAGEDPVAALGVAVAALAGGTHWQPGDAVPS